MCELKTIDFRIRISITDERGGKQIVSYEFQSQMMDIYQELFLLNLSNPLKAMLSAYFAFHNYLFSESNNIVVLV